MASHSFTPDFRFQRRIALADIDSVVSARLGPTRGLGNSQPACFNRQVAMYLAARISRWSTTVIGRFYNGRDHSTVCHGIQRVEAMRETDPDLDALLSDLRLRLESNNDDSSSAETGSVAISPAGFLPPEELEALADLIATKLYARLSRDFRGAWLPPSSADD